MRTKRTLRAVMGLVLILSILSSFAIVNAQDGGKSITVSIMGQDDIPTLDPSLAEDVSGIQAINMMFPGLTILNETTVQVEPGIASDWSVEETDEGAVYTFNLIEGIAWVQYDAEAGEVVEVTDEDGNVRMVTAQDFVYGWQRSLNPATSSYYANVLAPWVVGGADVLGATDDEGNVDDAALEEAVANLGIVAVDDYTVAITATGPFAFLPNIFGMWMARPLPSWTIEANGDFWTEPENIATYGPFALKEWANDESITFIKNPFWAGTDYIPAPALDEITNLFLEQSAALANYEAGELAYINPVSPADLDRVREEYPDQFAIGPGTCSYYYGFNVEKAPFDNVHARRAFSLALDRGAITEFVLRGGQVPAAFFTRPDMVAAPQQADYEEVALLTEPGDARIDAAVAEMEMYYEETGTTADDLPPITLMFNESETHQAIGEAAQQMWAEVLGVEVQLASQEWGTFLETRATDAPHIFRAAWCFDYPDAHNWTYDVMRSDSGAADDGGNEMNWVNEEFDALVNEAATVVDAAEREPLYGRAEVILAWEDAAVAPIYYYTTTLLLAPNVDGPIAQTGIESFEKWDVVD